MKIALCLILKPSDQEAEFLKRALEYTAKYVDGIFITITGKNKKVERVAKLYGAKVSYFKWDYSFANARNYNFKQVPKEYDYIMWMDADDVFRGLENLKKIVEHNLDCDGFTTNYLYWFDQYNNPVVVHLKTQIVKNDGCVSWVGELHEDFKQNRQLKIKFIQGIERLHLSGEERFEENKKRNLEIAAKMVKRQKNDPRVYWNLGNSQKALGKKDAIKTFEKFIEMSNSDEEKYIALLRLAEIYFGNKDFSKALETIKIAIGTKPEYPDAYHLRGHIYFEMKDYVNARDSYILGLKQKPPIYSIIVFNPRDYDYSPLKALAKTYFQMNLPNMAYETLKFVLKIMPEDKDTQNLVNLIKKENTKFNKVINEIEKLKGIKDKEKLKTKLDSLPLEIQSHPAICQIRNLNFVKTQSTGKDVVFYCGMTGEQWNPEIAKQKGIGGSEEAVINLAKGLVKKGWNVEVYNSCGHKEKEYDGVKYKPSWMWNYRDKQDVCIIWRSPKPVDYDINATKIYVDLHDTIMEGEFTEKRLEKIDKIMVKSKAHRDLYPNIPDNKFLIIPNGVDLSLFDKPVKRNPYYVVNFSSPDRGLSACLDIISEVRKRAKKSIRDKIKFGWFYGWSVFDIVRTSSKEQQWAQEIKDRFEKAKKEGWAVGGDRINHQQVALQNLEAGVLLYPSEFYEIDWIGGSKAQIAGCVPITSNFAAIGEKVKFGIKIASKKTIDNWDKDILCDFSVKDKKEMYVNALLDYFDNVDKFDREEMSEWAKSKFNVESIIDQWDIELKSLKKIYATV
jgi:tetratricopeptide (TPR) repeat protein